MLDLRFRIINSGSAIIGVGWRLIRFRGEFTIKVLM